MNRKFSPKTFNQLWVTDITEFALPIKGKKLYLSTIMDCYNSEVIARSPNLAIAINPLNKALEEHHHNLNQLVVHSDQGFHYQHSSWGNIITEFDATMSMSRKGNCLDNSPMENFFGLLKQEMFYGEVFKTYEALEIAVHEYIRYYNKDRIKLKLKACLLKNSGNIPYNLLSSKSQTFG
ncbi:putative transposase [Staphylococcus cohnii]|uniref:IS3 family transposase n=1 Tax=Staphylococcus cohnii TaxID=29382 RepID=UPI000A8A1313|nr:IS3 family transposase [Staphylococcus cohnii]MCI2941285.1 IS3 family transposase [Staphylococcus cohnii]SUM05572.1 transposase [Staphylococcus cohnii]SUM78896.1 transposase [Staphylococcus cohnii]